MPHDTLHCLALASLDRISLSFGHLPLLDTATLQVQPGERICVLGRNGTGKSTLLRIVSGEQSPDAGGVWTAPALRVARLDQDIPLSTSQTVFEAVADGLGPLRDLVAEYHRVAVALSAQHTAELLDALGRLQHELEERDGWRVEQRVELVLSKLGLEADVRVDTLSGGWRRRVLLARTLVADPDLLLLDEPTNHLDLNAILWLETFLTEYRGAVLFVTHDRAFLQRVATRIVELDRGRLTSWPGDYQTFLRKKDEWLANEAVRSEKFDKRLAQEEAWLRQGIKARRTRNEGRVKALMAMRAERAGRREQSGSVRLQVEASRSSGKVVFALKGVTKTFAGRPILRDVSTRILRGDRVGLIGPNGAGKTTLLRVMLGELPPDAGTIERGTRVEVAYYDQQREQLDPERTLFDTIGDGNDTVMVNGQPRHVNAYLQDFLFAPERALSPVKALSGGERNRLLIARLFTRPANVLVLDEPTNDLDLETLELLEAQLVEWPGTLLVVSHDRAFLDNVITSTLVFEGAGKVQEYVGGYQDWLRQRDPVPAAGRGTSPAAAVPSPSKLEQPALEVSPHAKKLSYREQQELLSLPARIDALEIEQRTLAEISNAAEFYKETPQAIADTLRRQREVNDELRRLYERWDALDSRTK